MYNRIIKQDRTNMKTQALKIGLGAALGVYIYKVVNNLLANHPISNALIDVDWKQIIFMGVFVSIFFYFFYKPRKGF